MQVKRVPASVQAHPRVRGDFSSSANVRPLALGLGAGPHCSGFIEARIRLPSSGNAHLVPPDPGHVAMLVYSAASDSWGFCGVRCWG